jgi:hypothetical protein
LIRIDVKVRNEEIFVRLETLPKRLREFLTAKLEAFLDGPARERLQSEVPGKYVDPRYIQAEVATVGSLLVGSLEVGDKPGVYTIVPTKANILRFIAKSGDVVFTKRVLLHPFPKGAPIAERYFRDHKPWLLEQTEDLIFDAVYDAR